MYKHQRSDSNNKIDILEREVKEHKEDIKQLCKNMSEMMIKVISLEEQEEQYFSETQNGSSTNGQLIVGLTNKEVFKCDQCDHYFDTKMKLKTHVDTKHEEPDFFQCKMYKSCFDSKNQLQKNTNTKHFSTDHDEYNFKCKVCGKTLWNSLDLIKHLNEHVLKENINYTYCL